MANHAIDSSCIFLCSTGSRSSISFLLRAVLALMYSIAMVLRWRSQRSRMSSRAWPRSDCSASTARTGVETGGRCHPDTGLGQYQGTDQADGPGPCNHHVRLFQFRRLETLTL